MKIALIVCWMGELPDYFDLWEYSCSKNIDYDFFIFTDHPKKDKYENVHFIQFDLNDFNELVYKKIKIKTNVTKAYKLCDFKPVYGAIFEDYLKKYDYWGHCDIDLIFGRISDFLPSNLICQYEKINKHGHFVLYKNNSKMNNLFKKEGSIFNYKDVFMSNENFAFDEYTGLNMISKKQNIKLYCTNDFADIDKSLKRYVCKNHLNYKYQMYLYKDGKIYKIYYDKNFQEKEMMYLHFQKKIPKINCSTFNHVGIGYKKYSDCISTIDKKTIEEYNGKDSYFVKSCEKCLYLLKKVYEFLQSSNEKKKIWIKQKRTREEKNEEKRNFNVTSSL